MRSLWRRVDTGGGDFSAAAAMTPITPTAERGAVEELLGWLQPDGPLAQEGTHLSARVGRIVVGLLRESRPRIGDG